MLFICQSKADNFALPYLNEMNINVLINSDVGLIRKEMRNYDFAWIEWGNDLCRRILEQPCPCKVMNRVHDWEIRMDKILEINYENVDLLWFINREAMADFKRKLPGLNKPMFFLPNAVDVSLFEENISDQKKIGALSLNNQDRKDYMRLARIYKKVYEIDNEWELEIRCDFNRNPEEFAQVANYLSGTKVLFTSHVLNMQDINDKTDVNEFFKDKSIVISTSNHEGFHYAIAEGMLCGCQPVVYNWEWGQPRDFWNGYVNNSEDEMVRAILGGIPSVSYRQYVIDNFSSEVLVKKLDKEIRR